MSIVGIFINGVLILRYNAGIFECSTLIFQYNVRIFYLSAPIQIIKEPIFKSIEAILLYIGVINFKCEGILRNISQSCKWKLGGRGGDGGININVYILVQYFEVNMTAIYILQVEV